MPPCKPCGMLLRPTVNMSSFTQDLVRIPSVNPKFHVEQGLNREADVQDRIEKELRPLGFDLDGSDALGGHPNVTGKLPGSMK